MVSNKHQQKQVNQIKIVLCHQYWVDSKAIHILEVVFYLIRPGSNQDLLEAAYDYALLKIFQMLKFILERE